MRFEPHILFELVEFIVIDWGHYFFLFVFAARLLKYHIQDTCFFFGGGYPSAEMQSAAYSTTPADKAVRLSYPGHLLAGEGLTEKKNLVHNVSIILLHF